MNIVVITNYTYAGSKVLDGFMEKGIPVKAIIVQKPKHTIISRLGLARDRWKQIIHGVGKHKKGSYRLFRMERINDERTVDLLKNLRTDLIVTVGGPILKKQIIKMANKGIINFHTSLLPAYRGVYPEFWQLYNNAKSSVGVTIHYLTENMDEGDIILQEKTPATMIETPHQLHLKNINEHYLLMAEAVRLVSIGKAKPRKQPKKGASAQPVPTRADWQELRRRLKERRGKR